MLLAGRPGARRFDAVAVLEYSFEPGHKAWAFRPFENFNQKMASRGQ